MTVCCLYCPAVLTATQGTRISTGRPPLLSCLSIPLSTTPPLSSTESFVAYAVCSTMWLTVVGSPCISRHHTYKGLRADEWSTRALPLTSHFPCHTRPPHTTLRLDVIHYCASHEAAIHRMKSQPIRVFLPHTVQATVLARYAASPTMSAVILRIRSRRAPNGWTDVHGRTCHP